MSQGLRYGAAGKPHGVSIDYDRVSDAKEGGSSLSITIRGGEGNKARRVAVRFTTKNTAGSPAAAQPAMQVDQEDEQMSEESTLVRVHLLLKGGENGATACDAYVYPAVSEHIRVALVHVSHHHHHHKPTEGRQRCDGVCGVQHGATGALASAAQRGEDKALPAWLHHHRMEVEPPDPADRAATVFPMARSATEAGVSLVGELVPPGSGFSDLHAQHDGRVDTRRPGGVFGGRGSAVDHSLWATAGAGGGGGGGGGALKCRNLIDAVSVGGCVCVEGGASCVWGYFEADGCGCVL